MPLTRTDKVVRSARGRRLAREVHGGRNLQAERDVKIVRLHPDTHVRVGDDVLLSHGVRMHLRDAGARIELGAGSFLNYRTEIVAHQQVVLGEGCLLAWDVHLLDSDSHPVDDGPQTAPIVLGDRVWVGCRATVLKGVHIGDGAVVAAGSVVVSDVPARALVGGNPARVLREGVIWRE